MSVNPYRRELQVARNLVTLRWAAIPVIFAFCYFAFLYSLGSNIQGRLTPIYILCCALAVFNIYLTLHISLLNRQLSVTKGISTLKRAMIKVISQYFGNISKKGIKGFFEFPIVLAKLASIIYLMVLETTKEFSFNPISLENIMHLQLFFDLVAILCLTRYTGSTESPLFFMAAVPIAIAGSVIGIKAGIAYSFFTCSCWFVNSLLISLKRLDHLKFFPPNVGDLSECTVWIVAYPIASFLIFTALTVISNKLTLAFKEKVEDLDKSLLHSKSTAVSLKHIALMQNNPWIVIDSNGKIINGKCFESLLLEDIDDKNLLDCLPDLEKTNFDFTFQSVLNSHTFKRISDVKIFLKDKSEHIYDLTISYYREFDGNDRIMISFLEKTLEVNRKQLVDTLSQECVHARNTIEKLSKENGELKNSLEGLSKLSSDKSIEIEVLNTKVNDMDIDATKQNSRISELMDNVAAIKSDNDQLKVELENKQMILEDVADFISSCSELDELISKVEQRTKDLFGLENSFFHVFDSTDMSHQKTEILDIRKVSPRLLDIPRNNPETLDPALTEGRPVVFNAEFRPEKSAGSIAITNGDLRRLVAFVPLKEDNHILGMMMLEKYGAVESSEHIVDMVSYYLAQVAGVIKSAVENRKVQNKNRELHEDMLKLHSKLDSVKTMILSDYSSEIRPFSGMLFEISKLVPLKDAMLVRIQSDGLSDCYSRINRSKALELNTVESKIIEQLKVNFENKISFKSENESDDVIAYPLVDKKRLLGVLFLYINEDIGKLDTLTTDFCVSILRNEFALHVLDEEREIWESFYSNATPA